MTDLAMHFGEDRGTIGTLAGKAVECSELTGLFCRSLKNNVESNSDDGGLECEILEGSLKSLKDSIKAIYVAF